MPEVFNRASSSLAVWIPAQRTAGMTSYVALLMTVLVKDIQAHYKSEGVPETGERLTSALLAEVERLLGIIQKAGASSAYGAVKGC